MPYKSVEKRKAYLKKWREKNKDKVKADYQKHKESRDENSNKYRNKTKPWVRFYVNAKQRCTNPNNNSYKWYGAKGIKFLLTMEEIEKLWKRDKAYLLDNPSIDREKSDLDYTFDNCRFVDRWINAKKKVESE